MSKTLGQFVAGIAHELNNPLQGVLGHLELMRATGAFPKDEYIDRVIELRKHYWLLSVPIARWVREMR